MFAQFLRFVSGWWLPISILSGFALLQILTIGYFLPIPIVSLIIDILLYTSLYLTVAILLWNTLKYANFKALNGFQQFVIYAALVILSLTLIIGVGIVVYTFIPFTDSDLLLNFIPIRILLSLLTILLFLQHFNLKICEIENNEIPFDEQKDSIDVEKTLVETKAELLERIAVKSGSKIHVVLVSEIVYVQSDGDYVHIFTLTGKYLKEQTMKYFEESLPPAQFVRVHRSFIVNVQAIARVELYDKQNQQLTLKNGHQIKASQAGYKLLRSRLNL